MTSRLAYSFLQISRLILGHLNPQVIKAIYVMVSSSRRIVRKNGLGFLARQLKSTSLFVYHYVSSTTKPSFINSGTFDPRISLTKSGIPRWLPKYFRVRIREKDPATIRIVLTFCNLYRVIPYPGKLKLTTITDP